MEKKYKSQYLKQLIILILFCIGGFAANATSYGCNLGNQIYPDATGKKNSNRYPTYFNRNPITIRWWDEDPNCGIIDNRIKNSTNSNDKCEVIGNSWGILAAYNPADNTCKVIPVPLDDYIFPILILVGCLGVYFINRRANLV